MIIVKAETVVINQTAVTVETCACMHVYVCIMDTIHSQLY